MFGATSIAKNSNKEKYVYSGYGIHLMEKVEWSFNNDTARNVVIFDVDSGSSCLAGNLMEVLVHQKKSLLLIIIKQTQKFCLSLHYNANNSYLFINEKKKMSSSLKVTIKILTFQLSFVL